ncbi:hypothetical protein ACUH92_08955 [Dermabacteraceae bacterium CCM 9520]
MDTKNTLHRYSLALPTELSEALKKEATEQDISVSGYITKKLARDLGVSLTDHKWRKPKRTASRMCA